ncbi:MAG: hypothetical protein LC623_01230 [Halobacteriales archaeon]|nr:hypothetical protein [Halobacteriales archaeon]
MPGPAGGRQGLRHQRLGTIAIQSNGTTLAVTPDQAETKDSCAAGASYW